MQNLHRLLLNPRYTRRARIFVSRRMGVNLRSMREHTKASDVLCQVLTAQLSRLSARSGFGCEARRAERTREIHFISSLSVNGIVRRSFRVQGEWQTNICRITTVLQTRSPRSTHTFWSLFLKNSKWQGDSPMLARVATLHSFTVLHSTPVGKKHHSVFIRSTPRGITVASNSRLGWQCCREYVIRVVGARVCSQAWRCWWKAVDTLRFCIQWQFSKATDLHPCHRSVRVTVGILTFNRVWGVKGGKRTLSASVSLRATQILQSAPNYGWAWF